MVNIDPLHPWSLRSWILIDRSCWTFRPVLLSPSTSVYFNALLCNCVRCGSRVCAIDTPLDNKDTRLAICFTGLMAHGLLPSSMLAVTLVPVIKDKAGKIGSVDNYRPIALASVVSKILEKILLDRLIQYLTTSQNQFGFKAKLGTELCIYAVKEATHTYSI